MSRSLSRARWGEYGQFLRAALERNYTVVPLEDWLDAPPEALGATTLVMRHDVDQHPATALRMASIEKELGIASTWYFRWRTAHPAVVESIRDGGGSVGLHYETLTRRALRSGLSAGPELDDLVEQCRGELRQEIAEFTRRFGPIRSVCPHGDTRVPGVSNAVLMAGQDWPSFGVEFDGNEAVKQRELGAWLTDRSAAEGGWGKGYVPDELLAGRVGPILAVVHPNNWVSGAGLWADRLAARVLPAWDVLERPVRTGSDEPGHL